MMGVGGMQRERERDDGGRGDVERDRDRERDDGGRGDVERGGERERERWVIAGC